MPGPSTTGRGLTVAQPGRSGAAAAVAARDGATAPSLTPVFDVNVTLGPPIEFGTAADGRRRFIPITGGTVSGPMMNGMVLPGGGDWQTIDADGTTRIHARYAMQASDGAVIEIDNPGVRFAAPEIIARLTAGENLDPNVYYFRTTPRFSPPATSTHDWLRQRVFVATGIRHPETVELRVYRID